MDQHRRKELQALLESILGSKNVYFQPPESYRIKYPCIIYTRERIDYKRADNIAYSRHTRYTITYIDQNKDGSIDEELSKLPYCTFDRTYEADNLCHNVYSLYY